MVTKPQVLEPLKLQLGRIWQLAFNAKLLGLLESDALRVGTVLRDEILAEVQAYSTSGNPQIKPALEQHTSQHVAEIIRLITEKAVGDLDFVRAHAQTCAEQRFPLEAILHAYRCGHRVLSHWLRDLALQIQAVNSDQVISAVADFSIEYTNLISSICAAEYVAHTRMLAEAETDQRTELQSLLLDGFDESDGRVARLLKRAGYLEQHRAYCVIVVQSTNAIEMENAARAQRIVNAVVEIFATTSIRVLVGIRNSLVTAILSDKRRQSGWTAPHTNLAERVLPFLQMLGPAVLIGGSTDKPSTAFLPKALNEARIALEFASVNLRVVQFSGLPLRELLVHHAADYVQSAAPAWLAALTEANRKSDGTLVETLRAVADADMNVQKAARKLGKHPNTIYTRMARIAELTGLDGQKFRDLTELLLAADCWRI